MHKQEDPSAMAVIRKHVNLEMLLVLAGVLIFCAFWIQYQMKNFVVTADEGNIIRNHQASTDAQVAEIKASFKEYQKDNEAMLKELRLELKQELKSSQELILSRMSEVSTRIIDRQDKNYDDLRDRIEGTTTRRVKRGN